MGHEACAIEQTIDSAEVSAERGDLIRVRHVEAVHRDTICLPKTGQRVLVDACCDHLGPLGCESGGCRAPDPLPDRGEQCYFSIKSVCQGSMSNSYILIAFPPKTASRSTSVRALSTSLVVSHQRS